MASGTIKAMAAKSDIPAVVNNLTSDSTTSALSAAQGKALNTKLTTKLNNVDGTHSISLVSDTNFIGFDIRLTGVTNQYMRFNFFDNGQVTISRYANGAWQTQTVLRNAD